MKMTGNGNEVDRRTALLGCEERSEKKYLVDPVKKSATHNLGRDFLGRG